MPIGKGKWRPHRPVIPQLTPGELEMRELMIHGIDIDSIELGEELAELERQVMQDAAHEEGEKDQASDGPYLR